MKLPDLKLESGRSETFISNSHSCNTSLKPNLGSFSAPRSEPFVLTPVIGEPKVNGLSFIEWLECFTSSESAVVLNRFGPFDEEVSSKV